MQEQTKQLDGLLAKINDAMERLDIDSDQKQIKILEVATQSADFWNDTDEATRVSQQLASLFKHVEPWEKLLTEVRETHELARMGDADLSGEIEDTLQRLEADYAAREFELKLSGPYDRNSAAISIYAGTGGTDAQDWAEMLMRMYLRYCEKVGYTTNVLELSPGEEAGIKSVTIEVSGTYAYGRLKSERGVHRLVRLSPYNSDNLRQTSFALVDLVPELASQQDVEIDSKDLRIDVYRSGGHGGQSVNTTDSAVRITHIPSGLVVAIQNERSQLQNKEKAMAILKGRLTVLMLEQHKAKVSEIRGANQSAAWGNQIRSYVLHPYTKVKDHRTNTETAQAQAVLDGDLELFIDAYLQSQIGKS